AGGPGDVDLRAVELEDRAVAGTADDRVGAVAPARIDHVTLIADALAVAARRRTGVVVAVRAGRAVRRRHVRLHAHREVGIGRADFAARERAHVAVRVPPGRAHLRGAPPRRLAALDLAGVVAPTRIDHVILVADALAVAACRRARVAVTVRAGRAVGRERVRLHAYPGGRIPRARLAA